LKKLKTASLDGVYKGK